MCYGRLSCETAVSLSAQVHGQTQDGYQVGTPDDSMPRFDKYPWIYAELNDVWWRYKLLTILHGLSLFVLIFES